MHTLLRLITAVLYRTNPDHTPIPHGPLQRLLSKAVSALLPTPYTDPCMEWQYGSWVGVFAAHDEWGRQLGEANVYPQWLARPRKDEWRRFQGQGCRHGHPYSLSALRQVTHAWDDVLLDTAALREVYCRRYQRQAHRLSAQDLYVLANVAVAIPGFLLRRRDAPVRDGALPVRASAAFKVLGGAYVATARMVEQNHPLLAKSDLTVDELLQYVEDERLLLSPEARACAAPVQMLRQLFTVLLEPPSGAATSGALPHLGHDLERLFAYGELCTRIESGVILHWRALGHYLQPLLVQSSTPAAVRDSLRQEGDLGLAEGKSTLHECSAAVRTILSLFTPDLQEQQLLAALPLHETGVAPHDPTLKDMSAHCHGLELAMRALTRQQQCTLHALLQWQPPKGAADDWSAAPGSQFLRHLLRIHPQLAQSF